MADGALAGGPDRRGWLDHAARAGRFLLTDRLGLLVLLWAVMAFVLRPTAMEYHYTGGGLLKSVYDMAPNPIWFARLSGLFQWGSLALLIVIVAVAHVRVSLVRAAIPATEQARRNLLIGCAYAVLLAVGYLCFVWTPTTAFTIINSDSFIFFDAAYRIQNGERPHVDFPTALGAATLYLPAAGAMLAGGYGGMVELASAPLALLFGLACAHAGMRRYPSGATAAFVVLVFLVTVPPVLLGLRPDDSHTFIDDEAIILVENTSYAMFYNRWGWAALLAVFAYLAPRTAPEGESQVEADRSRLIETGVLAAMLAFLFYLKITYFMVGCAAAMIYAFMGAKPWRTLAIGAGGAIALILAVGIPSGLLAPYLRDLAFVASINVGKSNTLMVIFRFNIVFMLLASAPLGILAALGRFTWKDGLIGGFLLLSSIYIIMQNAQLYDLITLAMLAGYGLARVWPSDNRIAKLAAVGAFTLSLLPVIFDRSLASIDQLLGMRREEIRADAPWSNIPALKNVYFAEREDAFAKLLDAKTPAQLLDAYHLSNRLRRKEPVRQGESMNMILAGIADLRTVMKPNDSIAALDMDNPFPFMMNARSARGSYITLDGNRTFSMDVYPDPAVMFGDADHVMMPKVTTLQHIQQMAGKIYGKWLDAHYEERVETLYWARWSRRKGDWGVQPKPH